MTGRTINLIKLSALALPFVAIGLVQIIQGQEQWLPEEYYDGHNGVSQKNISSRDIKDIIDDIKGGQSNGSGVVAYHRSLHNVSWAVTIPLFTFLLPTADAGDPLNIASQASYGIFAAIVVIIGFAIPILFNGATPGARSLENNKIMLNHLVHPGHLVNMVGANFQNQVGIDPLQCLQKTVCEANRAPQNERYGMLAYPFQYLFPAKNITEDGGRSIYEVAATTGKFTDTDCRKKYDCMFDVLDLMSYLLTAYQRAKSRAAAENSIDNFDKYSYR